jgi:transcriptional regulator with XRE-family HTH domain
MDKPSPKDLVEAVGISPSYASMILSGERTPPPSLAAAIWQKTGWKLGIFESLTDDDAKVAARIHGAAAA